MIYFAEMDHEGMLGSNRLIKIGYSTRYSRYRRKELQTGCPFDLLIINTTPGDPHIDQWLKYVRYAKDRYRREWFWFQESMLTIDAVDEWEHWCWHRKSLGIAIPAKYLPK